MPCRSPRSDRPVSRSSNFHRAYPVSVTVPAIHGTPRQIPWAEDVRNRFASEEMSESARFVFAEAVNARTNAGWWIDRRELSLPDLLGLFVEECGQEAEARTA